MPKRTVYHSSHTRTGWKTTQGGKTLATHDTQKQAEADAVARGNADHKRGQNSQAVLHKANGEIREERTYGADPEKTKG